MNRKKYKEYWNRRIVEKWSIHRSDGINLGAIMIDEMHLFAISQPNYDEIVRSQIIPFVKELERQKVRSER